jgi:iron complex outermembrane recepter protein
MNTNTDVRRRLAHAAMLSCLIVAPAVALAQQGASAQSEVIEEVVVTGTRRAGQSPTETLSPVDMIGGERIDRQAAFDLTESLTKVSPALSTQRFPIADGTSLVRPVSLRNLSPDHTLVLIDGTRRHRSALVNLQLAPLGTVNQGSQAVDWAAFPAAAIERVEILRDGASAQYGSDAIAGVINVILKDARDGVTLNGQWGEYYEGDGERLSVSGNAGVPLAEQGFVNVTAEYSESDITSRGVPQGDAAAVGEAAGCDVVPLDCLGQRWGDPEVEAVKLAVNAGWEISERAELYGFATYLDNDTVSDFFYRSPVLDPSAGVPARTTLQIDNDGDFLPDPAPQSVVDDIAGQGLDIDDYLVADAASPSGYLLRNPIYTEFPGGYNPGFGAKIEDYAVVVGARGEITPTLTWDVTGRYGENEVDYRVSGTINPSLGQLTPLDFRPGTLTQEESGVNLDFVRTFDELPLNVAFGAELRNETYVIGAGDEASITAGPTAAIFGVGSDGFQGFPEDAAGEFESDSWAAYVDVEADLTDRLSAAVAMRFEDYDEFDETFDWKVSGRYQVTDMLALRATANTGFRAPSPGQVNTLNVTTTSDAAGNLIPNGTYPVAHPVAVALGAASLEPEESQSFTVGLVVTPAEQTSITLDYYSIDIDDRLALLSNTIGPAEVALLDDAGVADAALLLGSNANFFVNGFDSEITGIDVAVSHGFEVGDGNLLVDLRHNWNEQEVTRVTPDTINASRVFDLEHQVPEHNTVVTFDYAWTDRFDALVRLNYYDGWETTGGLFSPGDASDQHAYGSALLVDLELAMTFMESYRVILGGENIFDELPDDEEDPTSQFLGVRYALTSPFGFNGGFWYLRLTAEL